MKTIFDQTTRQELIARINSLTDNSTAQWGKMTLFQMLRHCVMWDEMALGKKKYRQGFIGRLFGKMALRNMLKDDTPMKRNMPTVPGFKITDTGDAMAERKKWIALMAEYEHFSNTGFVHPFFGEMTREQLGRLVYKHVDHHLRQFNH